MLQLHLNRTYNSPKYCISHLYYNKTSHPSDWVYLCDCIEDTDRLLTADMPLDEIIRRKVYAQTAIPTGTYRITLNVRSPKFYLNSYYRNYCGGYLPRLLDVPGYDGILIHKGVNERSSAGCLIVGYNTIKGCVTRSQDAFEQVYRLLKDADKIGEIISIKITRDFSYR